MDTFSESPAVELLPMLAEVIAFPERLLQQSSTPHPHNVIASRDPQPAVTLSDAENFSIKRVRHPNRYVYRQRWWCATGSGSVISVTTLEARRSRPHLNVTAAFPTPTPRPGFPSQSRILTVGDFRSVVGHLGNKCRQHRLQAVRSGKSGMIDVDFDCGNLAARASALIAQTSR
jgi:hypothetical protein